jgi:agmatine deiminase
MIPHTGVSTPHQDSFYLPADTARLGRLWMSWPRETGACEAVIALVRVLSEFTPLSMVAVAAQESAARAAVGQVADIVILDHDLSRLRDTGPTFLVDGKGGAAAVDWRFNGWGNRAALTPNDESFAHTLLGFAEVRRFRAPLTLEGSAFVGDGLNTLLALAPAVFDPARNPGLSRLDAFAILQQWLGVSRVIWVENAHLADRLATDVRAVAAFAAPGRVLVSQGDDQHRSTAALATVARDLARVRDAQGKHLDIVPMPAPHVVDTAAPASYTGFLAVNGAVLAPAYGQATDERARAILSEQFPNHHVLMVPALALARFGLTLTAAALPHPARLLERDRASLLPRSAWAQPAPDVDAILQKYIDLAAADS